MSGRNLAAGLCALLLSVTLQASAEDKMVWPDLPTTGFVTGRAATVEDAKQGDAVFSMNGQSAGVLAVAVPQYVFWTDATGSKHPMILVQAELSPDGAKLVGLRDFAGKETVATLSEIELLGTKKPN